MVLKLLQWGQSGYLGCSTRQSIVSAVCFYHKLNALWWGKGGLAAVQMATERKSGNSKPSALGTVLKFYKANQGTSPRHWRKFSTWAMACSQEECFSHSCLLVCFAVLGFALVLFASLPVFWLCFSAGFPCPLFSVVKSAVGSVLYLLLVTKGHI